MTRRRITRWFRSVKHKGWRTRCEHCGRRFLPLHSRHSFGDDTSTHHDVCIGYVQWRGKARERLAVLDLVSDVWGIDAATVREVSANRRPQGYDSSNAWNQAWRVFYDLENHRTSQDQESGCSP